LKFGVIGFGSIGQRHVKNLISLGVKNIVLLRKIGKGNPHNLKEHTNITSFLDTCPDAIIISNPTSLHAKYLTIFLSENINLLVEKPLVGKIEDWKLVQNKLPQYKATGMTAFNMHYHPCVKETKLILGKGKLGKVYSARFFVGQYLPDWRPNSDYSKSYSAEMEMGGGVLFDLIHEIDLAINLFGKPSGKILHFVNKLSDLKINTEDLVEMLYRTNENKIISIHLDYLTHGYKRYIEIIGEKGSMNVNLNSNIIELVYRDGRTIKKSFKNFKRNDMYINMLSSFINSIKNSKTSPLPLRQGLISNHIAIDLRNKFYEITKN